MGSRIKDNGRKIGHMGKELSDIVMVLFTEVSGRLTNKTVSESTNGLRPSTTQAPGGKVTNTGKAS